MQREIRIIMTEKERLLKLMELQQVNAKQFAEEVGIQPGTISNIMKDRNKPSLEVLQRVLKRYSQVNPEWLVCGTGSIYRQKSDSQQVLFDMAPSVDAGQTALQTSKGNIGGQDQSFMDNRLYPTDGYNAQKAEKTATLPILASVQQRKVKKITILFDDGTFQELQ